MYMEFIDALNNLDEDMLFEMANISPKDSGVRYPMWVDSVGENRNNMHTLPRLKVQYKGQKIPVLLSDEPQIPESVQDVLGFSSFKDFNQVKEFIKQNKDLLLKHWNGKVTDKELLNTLIPYTPKRRNRYKQLKIKGM